MTLKQIALSRTNFKKREEQEMSHSEPPVDPKKWAKECESCEQMFSMDTVHGLATMGVRQL